MENQMARSVRPQTWLKHVGPCVHLSRTAVPAPYPMTPPPGQEVADAYYVVDHGREVGIFIDKYVFIALKLIELTFSPVYCPPAQPVACLTDTKSGSALGMMPRRFTIPSGIKGSLFGSESSFLSL